MSETAEHVESSGLNGSNGKASVFEIVDRWPMASAAAKYLRVKPQVISNMVQRGQLHPQLDAKGFRRYDPAELESFAPEEQDEQTESRTVAELTGAVKVLTSALGDYLRLIPGPTQKVHEVLLEIVSRQNGRIEALEAEKVQMLDTFAEFMRGRDERDLAKLQAERSETRKDEALHAITEHGPRFVQDLMLGADLRRLFESMDPRKIEALLDLPEMLTPEERQTFQKVHERMVATQTALKVKMADRAKGSAAPPPGKDDVDAGAVETEGKAVE